ncbi:MAG: hypothetical protein ACJ72E_06510 [Marmoricola sp.]
MLVLQVATAVGLVIDARIHLKLATTYDAIKSSTVSQGDLFRIEGALAIAAAVAVVLVRRPATALFAVLVAGGGLVPLLVYRYYDVGAVGPLPPMYEPAWYPDKTHTCIAQAVASVAAILLVVVLVGMRRRARPASGRVAVP